VGHVPKGKVALVAPSVSLLNLALQSVIIA
jgi:hypothetical protein